MTKPDKTSRKNLGGRAAVPPADRATRRNAVAKKPDPPMTKRGGRTRDHLKNAAIRVLEKVGYRAMRLSDIAAEADVNVSLIYHYFSGKSELTHEILTEFLSKRPSSPTVVGGVQKHPFEVIVDATRPLVNAYANSPGLMRCLVHFDEEEPDFAKLYRNLTVDWSRKIARDIARRCPDAPLSENQRLMIAYALGGMVDAFLFEVYVDRNPQLLELSEKPEEIALFLAILWYRALYLANPPAEKIAGYEGFLKLSLEGILGSDPDT